MKKDVVIIGAGPAGIFTALEMLKKGSKQKIQNPSGYGKQLYKQRNQAERLSAVSNPLQFTKAPCGRCVGCKPYCHITTGFSGAGAFSDGKLSLSCEVGGDLRLVTRTPRHTSPSRMRSVHS